MIVVRSPELMLPERDPRRCLRLAVDAWVKRVLLERPWVLRPLAPAMEMLFGGPLASCSGI